MKEDKYLEQDFKDNPLSFELDRRDFLKRMGGGLLITFSVSDYPLLFNRITDVSMAMCCML